MAAELALFGRFVGEWVVHNALFSEATETWAESDLRWSFDWIIGGRGIQDVLVDESGTAVGTTVRTWDARAGWRVVWFCPRAAEHVVLGAREMDDRIELAGVQADGRRVRWTFSGIDTDAFTWDGWCSNDDGATWWHEQHMDARRATRDQAVSVRRKPEPALGVGVLFAGKDGSGKMLAAEVLAEEVGRPLHRVDLSQVVSTYVGETEKNLGRVFDAAEDNGAILLLDEADALFGTRSEAKDSRHADIVAFIWERIESHPGLVIFATTSGSALDPAFIRRLRFVVDFPRATSEPPDGRAPKPAS
jgi:hypothetical protein